MIGTSLVSKFTRATWALLLNLNLKSRAGDQPQYPTVQKDKTITFRSRGESTHAFASPPHVLPQVLELVLSNRLHQEIGGPSLETLEDDICGVLRRHHCKGAGEDIIRTWQSLYTRGCDVATMFWARYPLATA